MNEQEFQFGERLSEETRMEMPSMTSAQELLSTPVPFENRIEFLSDYMKPSAQPETARFIAKQLHMNVEAVEQMAKAVGAPTYVDDNGVRMYGAFTREVIEEERAWVDLIDSLDDSIPIATIAYYLARHPQWVRERLAELEVYADVERRPVGSSSKELEVYPREVVWMLRTLSLHFPPGNDWYSPTEVEKLVGRTRDWIEARVEAYQLPSQLRTSLSTHRVTTHYSQETVDVLKGLACEVVPAGDWMNVGQIAEYVSKSRSWVTARLSDFAEMAQVRLDDLSREQIYYPPDVVEHIVKEAERVPPPANDWLTLNALATRLGVSPTWVKARIDQFKEAAEYRVAVVGRGSLREALHYPPHVAETLRSELKTRVPHQASRDLPRTLQ